MFGCLPVVAAVVVELTTSRTADRHVDDDSAVVDRTSGRWFDVAAAVALVAGTTASVVGRRSTIRPRLVSLACGQVLLYGALALSRAARTELGQFHRNALTVHSDQRVVDTGPYRHVRHPLYTATVMAFVGIGATLGNWFAVLATAAPIAALTSRIRTEEAMLETHLGREYEVYKERTRRLVPGVW